MMDIEERRRNERQRRLAGEIRAREVEAALTPYVVVSILSALVLMPGYDWLVKRRLRAMLARGE